MPRKKDKVVIYFRYNGRRLTASGDTRTEAEVNKALKLKALEENETLITSNTLVRNWIQEWLSTYKENGEVNYRWYKDIRGICNNYIVPSIGAMQIKMVRPVHLQRIINTNSKSKSFNDKLFDIIRQIFRTAYYNDLTTSDISISLVKAAGQKSHSRRSITPEERECLLHVLSEHRGKLFCYLMLYAGLRPGEVAALTWNDIDFPKRLLHVNKALKSDGIIRPEPKTKAGNRTIPLQDALYDALQDAYPSRTSEYICMSTTGNHHTKTTIRGLWVNICRMMNIEMGAEVYRNQIVKPVLSDDFVLYDLRHTFCTDLQSAGISINVARELMGHEDISITSKIYTHHSDISYSDALNKMNMYHGNP